MELCFCLTENTVSKKEKHALRLKNTEKTAGKAPGSKEIPGWRHSAAKEKQKMNLSYENIRIREACENDAALLCKWWNDGEVMAHAGFPLGLGITEKQIAEKIRLESDETTRRHIILIDDKPVGEMNYRKLDQNQCEMGIKICDARQQNKGYGTKILRMFLHGLFHTLHYENVVLDTNLNNKRAQHVYEKIGFKKVRVNINAWQDQLGRPQSSVDYAMNKNNFDWPFSF